MANTAEHLHCVIIGSGPAGYTAAVYAARANMNPVLFTGKDPGGQLMITNDVENYPGYPSGIMGPEMMEDFRKQAERFGTQIRYEMITKVDFSKKSTPMRLSLPQVPVQNGWGWNRKNNSGAKVYRLALYVMVFSSADKKWRL
jgi:alkyl hydroperoxide reductase subunit AhpF